MVVSRPYLPNMLVVTINQRLSKVLANQFLFKLVLTCHIHKARQFTSLTILHQLSSVKFNAFFFRLREEKFVSFYTPISRFCWITHRSKGRHRFIDPSLEGTNQGSVASHTEPSDGLPSGIKREV